MSLPDAPNVLPLEGEIDLHVSPELRASLRTIIDEEKPKRLVVDLSKVPYIDSSGIGELVSAYTAVRSKGGELKLLHLTKKVHDLLQITKLFTVFEVFSDEPSAVGSFK